MTTTDEIAAGAQAMYEADPCEECPSDQHENYSAWRVIPWKELPQTERDNRCRAFAAGLAAMPDHTAELYEALSLALLVIQSGPGKRDEEEISALKQGMAAIAKARARKGEGNGN